MTRIGVLSDTHGTLAPQVFDFFKDCDELWHAGDIGSGVLDELRAWKPLRAVWGNCDSVALHYTLDERAFSSWKAAKVWRCSYNPTLRCRISTPLSRPPKSINTCLINRLLRLWLRRKWSVSAP